MRFSAVVIIIAALASPARADKGKAEQYFRAGAEAFKHQSFAAAAEQFELAYKELELPEIAFSAAQAYRRQYFVDNKPEYVKRAAELYRIYLDKVKTGGRVGDAADGLAEMQRELDRLSAHGDKIGDVVTRVATTLTVSVTVEGATRASMTDLSSLPGTDKLGATATIDGQPVELFLPHDVKSGDHDVVVNAPGYLPFEERRHVLDGAHDVVEAEMRPQPAHLTVKTEDGAQIAVDGRPLGETPLPPQDVAAGKHILVITARGREPVVRELELTRGESRVLDAPLRMTQRRRAVPWLLYTSGAFVVGTGIAITVATIANSRMDTLENERVKSGLSYVQYQSYLNAAHERDSALDVTWVLGGAAVATAAIAGALYWFDLPRPTERTMIVPTATAAGGSVSLVGSF
jgi:hypothetical protein